MKPLHTLLSRTLLACSLLPTLATAEGLDPLTQGASSVLAADRAADQQRLAVFQAARADQAALLAEAEARLAAAEQQQQALKEQFDANELLLAEQQGLLNSRTGQLGEVFGVVKQQAKGLRDRFTDSLVSAQFPERAEQLDFAEQKRVPTLDDLQRLWALLEMEIKQSGQVVRFTSEVVQQDGSRAESQVARIGSFNLIDSSGQFLVFDPESQQLTVLSRQPAAAEQQQAANYFAGSADSLLVDPSRGSLLSLLSRTPNLLERIQQGGVVGYIILGLGAIGLLVAAVRLLLSSLVTVQVARQLKRTEKPSPNNPLGRMLQAASGASDREQMELRLDEALLTEVPKLERGLSLLKLLAAVAPLLGLLGTVTGMIGTFQSITLFGTGDPKMMAGGISQALVTTVLGLCVAIPLLFCHSYLMARTRRTMQLLQQKSLALLINSSVEPEPKVRPLSEVADAA